MATALMAPTAFSVKDHGSDAGDHAPTLRAMGHADSHANGGGQVGVMTFEPRFVRNGRGAPSTEMGPLKAESGKTGKGDAAACVMAPIPFDERQITSRTNRSTAVPGQECHTLHQQAPSVATGFAVRRLTPKECLRLMGFPDTYLDNVRLNNKPLSDSARYKLCGNSIAVPCLRWIKRRLEWCLDPNRNPEDEP